MNRAVHGVPALAGGAPNRLKGMPFGNSGSLGPGGTPENSPAFQRGVLADREPVPKGRLNNDRQGLIQPSLRD